MSFSISTNFEAQSFLSTFLNSSNDGVIALNLSDRSVVLVNPAMEKMLGASAQEIAELGPLHFMPTLQPDGQNSKDKFDSICSAVQKGKSLEFEHQHIKADGSLFMSAVKVFKISGEKQEYLLSIHSDITDRIEKNKPLNLKKEQFEFLFENTFDGMLFYDINKDKHVQCNDKLIDYFKCDSKEELLENYWNYSLQTQLGGINFKEAQESLVHLISKKSNHRYKWKHKTAKNDIIVSEIVSMKLSPPNQHFILSLFKDITEEENARKELEKSKKDLLNSQAMAHMASFRYEVEADRLTWSDYAYEAIGISEDEAPKKIRFFVDQVHPEDRSYFVELLFLGSKNQLSIETEFRLYDLNKEILYVQFKAEPTMEKGKLVFVGTVQDISIQKMGVQALTETNAKYIDLFDNMYDALLLIDNNGKFSDGNLAAEKMLGYNRTQLKKIKISDIVHPDDKEKSLEYLQKLIKEGFYSDYTGRIIRKDGSIRYLQVNSTAVYKNGVFSGSRDIARDITKEKEAEKKKEKLLFQLEKVNKELQDFAYVVSHDLKAPLRAISSLSTWLLEDYTHKLDKPGVQKLELLNNRVNRMHAFIEAILEYSKLGRKEAYKEKVNLKKAILNSIEMLSPPTNFEFVIKDELPYFFGDKTRFEQLFQNLLGNAIKYNDKEFGKVEISCKEDEQFLHFCIQDNGPGIPEKDHDKIFQIFKTLHSRDKTESTGIGLTIVKRIVELYGGKIKVNSELGRGTCFKFTLLKKEKNA